MRLVVKLPLRNTTLTGPVIDPIGKNARIHTAKTDPGSRCPQPCCSIAPTIATNYAETDLLQAEAETSRLRDKGLAWQTTTVLLLVHSESETLGYQPGTNPVPTRYPPQLGTNPCSLRLGV